MVSIVYIKHFVVMVMRRGRERETGTDRQTGEVQVCLLQEVVLFCFPPGFAVS